jgi:hypothetical protein
MPAMVVSELVGRLAARDAPTLSKNYPKTVPRVQHDYFFFETCPSQASRVATSMCAPTAIHSFAIVVVKAR